MIKTPISLQDLRRTKCVKAKAEPSWRFWGLGVSFPNGRRTCGRVAHMLRSFMFRVGCVLCCVAATIASLRGQPQQAIAHVLDVKGEWHLPGTAVPAAAGEGLMAGARITAGSDRPGDVITIVRDDDMSRERIACDASATNPCRNPIVVEGTASVAPTAQSQLKSIVQTAIAVLLNKPPAIGSHYALTLTRGHETVQEWEGVVALDPAQGIELPAAPLEMPAGRYTVSIGRAGEAPSSSEQPALLTSEGTWRPLALHAAGLYEVSILDVDGIQVVNAMLLVVTATEYETRQKEFETVKSRTSAWTGPSARADEHLFLRAFLLSECRTC
jgi:hypothetical protein